MNREIILSLSPDEHMFFTELSDAIDNALEKLSPELRETLMLSRSEKLKYHEIAQRLNVSVRTVEVRISKALKYLRSVLGEYTCLLFFLLPPPYNTIILNELQHQQ